MKRKTKHSSLSVVSINPYKESYIGSTSTSLLLSHSPKYSKDQYAISYLSSKNLITSQISISKNIPQRDLYDALVYKVYDELALDQTISYHIEFIETFNSSDAKSRNFSLFIVDPIELEDIFCNVVSKIKYIQSIIPLSLLFKSLYEKDIIESSATDAFIYFEQNDASITIYDKEEFLYTKSINFSFIQMHERFCELYAKRVSYEDFIDFLSKESLKNTLSDYKEPLIKLYKEIFVHISDILTYVKRAYELKSIKHIYIDSQAQTITKLYEICEVELGVESSSYDFDYGFRSDGLYVEQLHYLMHLYTTLSKEQRYNTNFTPYNRPAKFIQRESGRFIILGLVSSIIALLYPLTYWALSYKKSLDYDLLSRDYAQLHSTKLAREATIKKRLNDKTEILALVKKERAKHSEKAATLKKIHNIKVNYPLKAKLLNTFTKELNEFAIEVDSISYDEEKKRKTLTLNLLSKRDKEITQLLQHLTKTYKGRYDFSLRRIELKDTSKHYFSELRVAIL